MNDDYTVGVAAELTGTSVRALHHYDQIGLVRPSSRSAAGYRFYTDADLAVLQRVVFYRELGLDLADIGEILGNPSTTDEDHLRRQRDLVEQRISRCHAMLALIDEELTARGAGIALTPQQRREIFGGDRLLDHVDEARREWGDTPEFVQRQQRTARYTEQDWMRLRTELSAINQELADAMTRGVLATDPVAMDLAERLRQHTDRWFHDCDYETHRGMAEHYRANRRSGRNYDDMVPGLSRYVHDAIIANCRRAKVSG
jgi:DNA-binding transcriptional MerR regulator